MNEQKSSELTPAEGSTERESGTHKTASEEKSDAVGSSPTGTDSSDAQKSENKTDARLSDDQKSENKKTYTNEPKSSEVKLTKGSTERGPGPSQTGSEEKSNTDESSSTGTGSSNDQISENRTDATLLDDQESLITTFTIDDVVDKAGYGKFQKIVTFLAGLGWLADAFEVIILSIIGDMLACKWYMERWQNALMTSTVFAGMAVGAPLLGSLADIYGRRTILAASVLLLFIFGAASAASPDYTWMVILRAFMGFSIGGMAQGVTLCCEYYPAKYRGSAGFYLSYYWSLGTLGIIGFAWIIMDILDNWRVFLFVAAVPALIVFLSMKWYPESARYYLVSNQPKKALKTLQKLARWNNVEMPEGKLVEMHAAKERGKILDLLKPQIRKTTLLFWYIWIAVACAYYGIALTTPLIISNGSLIATAEIRHNTSIAEDFRSVLPCRKYSNENYFDLFWTSAAEFPGLLIFSIIVNHVSRKIFLGTACLINAFLMLFLMLEMKPKIALFIVLFICRGLVSGVFQLLFIMTTEAFPTTLRASAMGTGSGCARIGGLIIPYLAQVTITTKPIPSMTVLAIVYALAGVAALLLPKETQGKHMEESIQKDEESIEKDEENKDNITDKNAENSEKDSENVNTEVTDKNEEKG